MGPTIESNKQFLKDLFGGPFRGHALIMESELPKRPDRGDVVFSERPVGEWVDWAAQGYLRWVEQQARFGDDAVPYVKLWTGTGLFAATFGCRINYYEDAPPSALPAVTTAAEADRLPIPGLDHQVFQRAFEFADRVRERLGPDTPVTVPDIQSPFDIASLVWRKQDLYTAIYDTPDAVKRLVDKCTALLKSFFAEFMKRVPHCNLSHCPHAWAAPEYGIWLSEDEAGGMSASMFEEFCLPSLVDLSECFGGMFIHCCATADHQYANFKKIPNLRGMNRIFQAPGPGPAIEAFSEKTVLMVAWSDEKSICGMLDMALPTTRFLFNPSMAAGDDAAAVYCRLRARCPRT